MKEWSHLMYIKRLGRNRLNKYLMVSSWHLFVWTRWERQREVTFSITDASAEKWNTHFPIACQICLSFKVPWRRKIRSYSYFKYFGCTVRADDTSELPLIVELRMRRTVRTVSAKFENLWQIFKVTYTKNENSHEKLSPYCQSPIADWDRIISQ
jgi:hypothetical protein